MGSVYQIQNEDTVCNKKMNLYAYTRESACVSACVCMRLCVHVYVRVCVHVCMCFCVHVCMCVCLRVYVRVCVRV